MPDEIWDETASHYNERQLAALALMIGVTNLFNRLNATTKQAAGEWAQPAEVGASSEKDHVAAR